MTILKDAAITQRKRTEQRENKFMERAAFQRHLPSEQNAEEESRKQKKLLAAYCWHSEVLTNQKKKKPEGGLPNHPSFDGRKETRGVVVLRHSAHTQRQSKPHLN